MAVAGGTQPASRQSAQMADEFPAASNCEKDGEQLDGDARTGLRQEVTEWELKKRIWPRDNNV